MKSVVSGNFKVDARKAIHVHKTWTMQTGHNHLKIALYFVTLCKLYDVSIGFVIPPPLFCGSVLLYLRSP